MDRQTVIGFILIALVLVLWIYFSPITEAPKSEKKEAPKVEQRESRPDERHAGAPDAAAAQPPAAKPLAAPRDSSLFGPFRTGSEQLTHVSTSLYDVEFSTLGGGIRRFTLKNFFTWNNLPIQLINWKLKSDFNLVMYDANSWKEIDSRELYFRTNLSGDEISLKDSAKLRVEFYLPLHGDSIVLKKVYTLRNGSYLLDYNVELTNMANVIAGEYDVVFQSPPLSERNSVDESGYSHALTFLGSDLQTLDASNPFDTARYSGFPHWIGLRNKYFANALLVGDESGVVGARIEGTKTPLPDEGMHKSYKAFLHVKYGGNPVESTKLSIYLGPIEYSILKEIHPGFENLVDLGWTWLVRPIAVYFMIPLFKFLHSFVPNFGVVIILFSLIIKVILHPLTKSSMDSMRKMQALQPMMNEIKEKHKEDPQKMNAEVMKLYQEYGINPMGGCLPLLLQMPILYALFKIFSSTIQLRQSSFVWWIHDLSIPDTILKLPFKFPLFGFTEISGLAVLMGITMFIQQKQSVKDPRQKSMVYIMPIMFTLMFNGFPSGLNLYYFVFNLLSIGQQYMINKKHKDQPLVKAKRKKGWMQRYMENAQSKQKGLVK